MGKYVNQTIKEFKLLGFPNLYIFKGPVFSLLLLIYCVTILVNLLIIVLISTSKTLHSPMYFFIRLLSISDLLLITAIVPLMLHIVINDGASITLSGCLTQYVMFACLELFECFLLTVMSYDRYLAICNPLRYSSIMDHQLCITLGAMCWILGFSITITFAIALSLLDFCGQNIIDHFFCDPMPLMEISCSDTFLVKIEILILAGPTGVVLCVFIIITYIFIAFSIQKIKSNIGRQKAFSTCSSHLAVVVTFYGALIAMYIVPHKNQSSTINKILSLLYTVMTPLLNPIIYSVRSNDMKEALVKFLRNLKLHSY